MHPTFGRFGLGGNSLRLFNGGGPQTGRFSEERTRFAGPWLVMVLLPIPSMLLHVLADGWRAVLIVVLLLLATGAVGYSTWHALHKHRIEVRFRAVITIALVGLWLILTTFTGFISYDPYQWKDILYIPWVTLHHPAFEIWMLGGMAVATVWCIQIGHRNIVLRNHEVGLDESKDNIDPWEAVGLPGLKVVGKPVDNNYREETIIRLPQGSTVMEIQSRTRSIESIQGWPTGSVRVVAAEEFKNARMVRMIHMKDDPLVTPPIWPGLNISRRSTLLDPCPIGVRDNGDPATLQYVSKIGGQHVLEIGMTGAGKTYGNNPSLIWKAALGGDIIIIDTVKGTQSFRNLAPILRLYEVKPSRALAVLDTLANRTLRERTDFLADRGLDTWRPGCGLNFLFVHIEEAWALIEDTESLTRLALALRSAGGQLTISLQRGSADQLNTTLRQQLAIRRCYGVMDPDDVYYALPDQLADALGTGPADWGNQTPGMQIVSHGGLSISDQARPVRSYTDVGAPISFSEAARQVGAQMGSMCPVTATSLGSLWDNRIDPVDLVSRRAPLVVSGWRASPEAALNTDDRTDRMITPGDDVTEDIKETFTDLESGDDPMDEKSFERLVVAYGSSNREDDPWADIPGVPPDREPVIFGGTLAERISDEEFNTRMDDALTELLSTKNDGDEVTYSDFTTVALNSGHVIASIMQRFMWWASDAGGYRLVRRDDGSFVVHMGDD